MKKILLIFPIFFSGLCFSQPKDISELVKDLPESVHPMDYASSDDFQNIHFHMKLSKYSAANADLKEYFNSNFSEAKISGFKEKEKLRYNAHQNHMEFLRDGFLYKLDAIPNQYIQFDNGDVYKNLDYTLNDKPNSGYLKILSNPNGQFVLCKKYNIDKSQNVGGTPYQKDLQNGYIYSKTEKTYILKGDQLFLLPKNNKKLSELLGVNVDELIKSNNLNTKNETDLIKLINLANK